MPKRWVIALLAAAVLLPAARAQMGGGVSPPALTAVGNGFPVPGGVRFTGAQPGFVPHRAIFLGTPFLFPNYPSEPVVLQAPPPQIVVVQQPAALQTPDAVKPGPLLIEWQGDRYVRVTGNANRSTPAQPDYVATSINRPAPAPGRNLPPAVLVFQDGSREEVRDYAIIRGVMYAHGDYWKDGYWTKQIQLSALDVPATLEANQQRGVKFILPAGPNEVVTRP
jgi:hypothetical protein